MSDITPKVERVGEPTEEIATAIGQLNPVLSARLNADPIPHDVLDAIISSPDRDLFVARVHGRIVGTVTMNLIVFPTGRKAWVENNVVSDDESVRGHGVGYALWQEIVRWAAEREATLEFTSAPTAERASAYEFYFRQGAEIKPTNVFTYDPSSGK